jgi:hypothetical protein
MIFNRRSATFFPWLIPCTSIANEGALFCRKYFEYALSCYMFNEKTDKRARVTFKAPSKLRGCAVAQSLKCSGAHWIVAVQLEFVHFHCKYSYYVYYKKILKCRAVVRLCKIFLPREVAGPRSCKTLEGRVVTYQYRFQDATLGRLVFKSQPVVSYALWTGWRWILNKFETLCSFCYGTVLHNLK